MAAVIASKKNAFPFGAAKLAQKAPDERQAEALEFIAHYLDRIDSHLEALVSVTDANGGGFLTLKAELTGIRAAIDRKK